MARLLPYLTTNNTMGVSSGTGTAYHWVLLCVYIEKTKGTMTIDQSRDTGNIGHETQNEDTQSRKHNKEN
jgi:hypothetical protein